MVFADPMFLTPLSQNPFLRDYKSNTAQNQSPVSPIRASKNNESHPQSTTRNRGSYSNSRDFNEHERQCTNTRATSSQQDRNRIDETLWEIATDPFGPIDGSITANRLIRIQNLAEALKKDDERGEKRHQECQNKKSIHVEKSVLNYIQDPEGDFGSLDLNRAKRVQALVNAVPKSNHIIAPPNNDSKASSINISISHKNFGQRLQEQFREMNTMQNAYAKIKKDLKRWLPKNELRKKQDLPKIQQKINAALLDIRKMNETTLDNLIRGFVDTGTDTTNQILKGISQLTGTPHNSKTFLAENKLGHTKETLASLHYWVGYSIGCIVQGELIWGKLVGISGPLLNKTLQATKKMGLGAAIYTKLSAHAMGKGLNQYMTKAVGGAMPNIHITNPYRVGANAILNKAAHDVVKHLQNTPKALKNVELVAAVQKMQQGSIPFLKHLVVLTKLQPTANISAQAIKSTNPAHILRKKADEKLIALLSKGTPSAVFQDLGNVIDSIDHPEGELTAYRNYTYQDQIKNLFSAIGLSEEASNFCMHKIPSANNFEMDQLGELIKTATRCERILRYCQRHKTDSWVKKKLLELGHPFEKHFILVQPDSKFPWKDDFQTILDKYGLNLNHSWNATLMPRIGKPVKAYYQWAWGEMKAIDSQISNQPGLSTQEQSKQFLKLFRENIKAPLQANPLMSMGKWYRHWKQAKVNFESQRQVINPARTSDQKFSPLFAANSTLNPEKDLLSFINRCKIHKGLQLKHFVENGAIENKKSIVYWNLDKIAEKIKPLLGKGMPLGDQKFGERGYKEIIKFDEVCGECCIEETKYIPTQYAKVHYRHDGYYHIVPYYPMGDLAKKWEQKYGTEKNFP